MTKAVHISTRFEPRHLRKIDLIVKATGLNRSQVIRELVDRATFAPTKITVNLAEENTEDLLSLAKE